MAQLETILQWGRLEDANRVELHQRPDDGQIKAWFFRAEPPLTDSDYETVERLKLTFTGQMN